uniref:Putative secreted protein n=1 Tax=Anopheles marajoara TaxID=58244 RepID=A0A2M4C5Z5_9DIPT
MLMASAPLSSRVSFLLVVLALLRRFSPESKPRSTVSSCLYSTVRQSQSKLQTFGQQSSVRGSLVAYTITPPIVSIRPEEHRAGCSAVHGYHANLGTRGAGQQFVEHVVVPAQPSGLPRCRRSYRAVECFSGTLCFDWRSPRDRFHVPASAARCGSASLVGHPEAKRKPSGSTVRH